MLKQRLIACLVVKDGIVVQSIGFRRYLPVGRVSVAVEFLNHWGVDEIILLDIDASRESRPPNFDVIEEASRNGFVPLTFGGGIKSVDDMKQVLASGADKIAINHAALEDPSLVQRAASVFGNQCIVVSLDTKRDDSGTYELFAHAGAEFHDRDPFSVGQRFEELGAGEILLNSVDRDGSKRGYDLELIERFAGAVSIPVIVCGGVGHPRHFCEGLNAGAISGVAAANFFHFSEHSVITAKSYIRDSGTDVRLGTYADYEGRSFLDDGRIAKRSDDELSELLFEKIMKETI